MMLLEIFKNSQPLESHYTFLNEGCYDGEWRAKGNILSLRKCTPWLSSELELCLLSYIIKSHYFAALLSTAAAK